MHILVVWEGREGVQIAVCSTTSSRLPLNALYLLFYLALGLKIILEGLLKHWKRSRCIHGQVEAEFDSAALFDSSKHRAVSKTRKRSSRKVLLNRSESSDSTDHRVRFKA